MGEKRDYTGFSGLQWVALHHGKDHNLDYFERKLDDKNRLTIPSELRHEFETGRVIITRGFAKYLHLYTEKVWNEDMEPALKGDILDERTADLNVQFRSGKTATNMAVSYTHLTLPTT